MKRLFGLFVLIGSAWAQTPQVYPGSFSTLWQVGLAVVPNTNTAVCGANTPLPCNQTVYVDALVVANTSVAPVTVTVTDNSTNCNNGPCQLFPGVSVAANQVYTVNLLGVPAVNGLKWQASTANAVNAFLRGKY